MKIARVVRPILFLLLLISTVSSQTPQDAAACAQEMIVRHVGNVAPAHVGCALNVAIYLRELNGFPDAAALQNGLSTAFTNCYGAMRNADELVNKLINNLNEINDVNATTFGGSSCLRDMWTQIDAALASANESAQANSRPRTNTGVAEAEMNRIMGGYSGQPGGSSGDPHIVTLDGFRYGFQAEGVFSALLTSNGDLEIQVLQKRLPGVQASQNEAIAIKFGKTVLNLAVKSPDVFVNGKRLTQTLPATLTDGIQISQPKPKQYLIKTPKGDSVSVRFRNSLLDYFVKLMPHKIGAVTGGILGNFDFNKKNELISRNGIQLSGNDFLRKEKLYSVFGDSWRIEPKGSLFASEILSQYHDFDTQFPVAVTDSAAIPDSAKRQATMLCKRKGISDEAILDDCVHDLALTRNPEFADSAEFAQNIKRNPDDAFRASPPAAAQGFRGMYSFDYGFTDGVKQSVKRFDVAVSDEKTGMRWKLKNGVSKRVLIDDSTNAFLNITEFENSSIPSIATKQSFSKPIQREELPETIRTDETKTILGYLCRKYLYQGHSISGELWVAESLSQTQFVPIEYLMGLADRGFLFTATLPKFFSMSKKGMVLEANLKQTKTTITFRVKTISISIDPNFFDVTGLKIMGYK